MKRIMIMTLIFGMLITGTAFADLNPLLISTNPATTVEQTVSSLFINGVKVDKDPIIDETGVSLYPLKVIAEGLGYQVVWQPETRMVELIKGARYITLKTTENYYTFSRRTPETLEAKATIKEGSTYVPASFFEKFLEAGVLVQNQSIEIFSPYEDQARTGQLIIRAFEDGRILADHFDGEAVIIPTEETLIKDRETGLEMALEDLKIGDTLKITHPSVMILIYPPQYSAFEIERINDVDYNEGTVSEIGDDWILIKSLLMDIRLNIDSSTKISNHNHEVLTLEHLRVGNKIKVYHSKAMTRSLPPQTYAYEIIVDTQVK